MLSRAIAAHTIRMIFIDRNGEAAASIFDALGSTNQVHRLERDVSAYSGRSCVALCSTDAAIHTALFLCGVRDGDYVFAPTFTFYSYIASIDNAGGVPVFLDCDPVARCVSAAALEAAFVWAELQNKPPKAVMVDNAFGSVADYDVLLPLCKAYGVPLIELAVDAFFGEYKGKPCGANGDYGVLGFGKRLPGGGGALVCGAEDVTKAKQFSRAEYSDGENHDYRLHNAVAALDCAHIQTERLVAARARKNLIALSETVECIARPVAGDAGSFALLRATKIMGKLRESGFDVKKPPLVHTMPRYSDCYYFEHEPGYSVCRSFDDYVLVGMDMSTAKRRKLAKIMRNS